MWIQGKGELWGLMTISQWYYIIASPFNHSSVMVLCIGILINLSMLIDRSHSQLVTGVYSVVIILISMFGK